MRTSISVLFVLTIFFAGCTTVERVVVERPLEVRPALERPLPYEIPLPGNYAAAIAAGTRTSGGAPGPDYWIQSATYDLTARLMPESRRLEGRGTIVYRNNSPDVLDQLHLELVQNLHSEGAVRTEFAEVTGGVELQRIAIDGLEVSAEPAETEAQFYEVVGTNLIVYPPSPIQPNSEVELEIEWAFSIAKRGASGRMGYDDDNLFYVAYWYPIMAVYDDVEGWYNEQFMGQAEFYADFADYRVTVEVPDGWVIYGTGELQNPQEVLRPEVLERMRQAHESDEPMQVVGPEDFGRATRTSDGRTLRWRYTAEQVRDFAFSATRESIWDAARTPVGDRDGDGTTDYVHINTFYRESAPRWTEVTRYQQHAITFLSDYTGLAYPWPHMTAVEGSGIIGGGMEYPMMTLMGDYNARGDTALYNVTAHELAHMWVPMIVNVNERRFSWIDEGITTFNENEARHDFGQEKPYLPDQDFYLSVALRDAEGEIMRPSAYHATTTAFVNASYMKPAVLLVALREVLGEEVFNRAYRTFIDEWAYRHPYPHDLFNTFERVSGRDLDWFWRPWFYETWTMDQAVEDVISVNGATTITIVDEGLAPMPVHLEITLDNGEILRREVPVDVWLNGARSTSLTEDVDSPVTRVEIDPGRAFPDIDRSNNVWPRSDAPTGTR